MRALESGIGMGDEVHNGASEIGAWSRGAVDEGAGQGVVSNDDQFEGQGEVFHVAGSAF